MLSELKEWSRISRRTLRATVAKVLGRPNPSLKFDYLFIISYGRSGSTLLQGILNSINGVIVRGENNNFVEKLYQADKSLRMGQSHRLEDSPQDAWYGIGRVKLDSFRSGLRRNIVEHVLHPRPGDTVVGFKEIRYDTNEISDADFDEYLDFLRTVFPRSAFVFNTRNIFDVAKSSWWSESPESIEILSATEQRFLNYLKRNHPDCFHIHYDDYVENPAALIPLFEFLGAHFDQTKIEAVMSIRHSFQ